MDNNSKTILFITDLLVDSRVQELAGISEIAAKVGWHVEYVETSRLQQSIAKTVAYWTPAGCILEGHDSGIPSDLSIESIPTVHLDPSESVLDNPRFSTVTNDAPRIVDLAIRELSLAGSEHFAFISWMTPVGWSQRRQDLFSRLLSNIGRNGFILDASSAMGDVTEFTSQVRTFLTKLPRRCGIFAANDYVASIVLSLCKIEGLRVPGDFYVVGVDDNPNFCDNTHPSLTSIRPDFTTGGRMAAWMLARRMAAPNSPPEKELYHPCWMTRRLSTRHVVSNSANVLQALDKIRREACSGLKAADVVREMGLSERMAEMTFKAATGKRITEEITDVRLERVKELLSRPSQAIAPIANLCGWDSEIYLKRLFKQRTGMTMREWRAKQGGLGNQRGTASKLC